MLQSLWMDAVCNGFVRHSWLLCSFLEGRCRVGCRTIFQRVRALTVSPTTGEYEGIAGYGIRRKSVIKFQRTIFPKLDGRNLWQFTLPRHQMFISRRRSCDATNTSTNRHSRCTAAHALISRNGLQLRKNPSRNAARDVSRKSKTGGNCEG